MKLSFRQATATDLPLLIKMLADDRLGKQREDSSTPLNKAYIQAFKQIDSDPNNQLILAQSEQQVVGMLQLTFIPYLTHTGSWRCLIEGVRIDRELRGKGIGNQLIQWAIKQARENDCNIVQLTSDKQRPEAISFYESLGFKASHEGFKLVLKTANNA
ncbi:MAG: GNAT family N-acetyltransferase [Proteobacteria bacterium]|nr:GNAT family N-acetyltransferase [Pseudomonadota bacterium]